ncbi:MAG TPA: hypothetical protein VJN21_06690 [Candidatus Acidoferrales bacterium]|nr:hypothetical protein [Candidatus Acidoferrales bacterium]
MTPSRLIPVCVILVLAALALFCFARGRKNQMLDGVFIRDNQLNEFYPGNQACPVSGLPDWVITNQEFKDGVSVPISVPGDRNPLYHAPWHVRITGDVSRLGSYGWNGRYWREVRVLHLIEAGPLPSCKNAE